MGKVQKIQLCMYVNEFTLNQFDNFLSMPFKRYRYFKDACLPKYSFMSGLSKI